MDTRNPTERLTSVPGYLRRIIWLVGIASLIGQSHGENCPEAPGTSHYSTFGYQTAENI